MILYRNSLVPKKIQFTICREVVMSLPLVIYSRKHFYLLDELSKNIEHLKSSGLIDHWHRKGYSKKFEAEESSGQRVLEVHDFEGCFFVVLCGFAVGVAVFCVEVLMGIVTRKKRQA
jgi:hypothetical protein